MAYYTALIAAWNAGGVPAGATGTAITGGMTTAQKIDAVNSWTVAGPTLPVIVDSYQIFDCLDPTEFDALTAANKTRVRDLLNMGRVDGSSGKHANTILLACFGAGTNTRAALVTLANTFKTTIPWWKANGGLSSPINASDASAAGLS